MRKNRGLFIGIGIFILIAAVVGLWLNFSSGKPDQVTVNGPIGGEKIGFVENPAFKEYVKKNYGLTFKYKKAGSLEMVEGDVSEYDYLFPSSDLPVQKYEKEQGKTADDTIIFNTPIVIYSWKPVAESLEKAGVVSENNGIYEIDMQQLAHMIADGITWESIGMDMLYGPVLVDTTDPNASNSGNMFLGLLANALNNNQPVQEADLADIIPQIDTIYTNIGYMYTSSSDLFSQFVKQGMGRFPLAAGYENQLLEYSKESKEEYEQVREDIVMFYPAPTVWSSHVYISQTEAGDVAREAMLDSEMQALAWDEHGFRTGPAGSVDISKFNIVGLADELTNIIPLPNYEVMMELMNEVAN